VGVRGSSSVQPLSDRDENLSKSTPRPTRPTGRARNSGESTNGLRPCGNRLTRKGHDIYPIWMVIKDWVDTSMAPDAQRRDCDARPTSDSNVIRARKNSPLAMHYQRRARSSDLHGFVFFRATSAPILSVQPFSRRRPPHSSESSSEIESAEEPFEAPAFVCRKLLRVRSQGAELLIQRGLSDRAATLVQMTVAQSPARFMCTAYEQVVGRRSLDPHSQISDVPVFTPTLGVGSRFGDCRCSVHRTFRPS